jgi:DNA-directed RNA polymerase subunit RPC12/RpoP
MIECPHCGSDLNRPTSSQTLRNGDPLGDKSTGSELVSCPDCDSVIDGFTAH